jgi:hypothetical protein
MILWQVHRGTPDCWDKQAMDICRVFSTISFKSSSISSDTGARPNDLPLLIVLIVKNLFTMLFRYFDGIHFYKQIIPHY